jgi:putative membrane protein
MPFRSIVLTSLWVTMWTSVAAVQGGPQTKGNSTADTMFIQEAAMSSMAEVAHGQLAAKNASAAAVKEFGGRMVDDHTKANEELKGLASQKSVTLPTQLDQKHQAVQDRLAKLTGDAFDKAYMQHMVTAHQQAVSVFERETKTGKDADAKGWAAKTLPVVQQHLKMARDINAKIGGT